MRYISSLVFFFLCFTVMLWTNALAYVDPSAMTYVIQAVAAAVIVGGAAISFNLKRIKRAIQKKKEKKNGNAPAAEEKPAEQADKTFDNEFKED